MSELALDAELRRSLAYHEAGHAALLWWRRESLRGRRICIQDEGRIHADPLGSNVMPVTDTSESDLMVLLGGPVAEMPSIASSRRQQSGSAMSTLRNTESQGLSLPGDP